MAEDYNLGVLKGKIAFDLSQSEMAKLGVMKKDFGDMEGALKRVSGSRIRFDTSDATRSTKEALDSLAKLETKLQTAQKSVVSPLKGQTLDKFESKEIAEQIKHVRAGADDIRDGFTKSLKELHALNAEAKQLKETLGKTSVRLDGKQMRKAVRQEAAEVSAEIEKAYTAAQSSATEGLLKNKSVKMTGSREDKREWKRLQKEMAQQEKEAKYIEFLHQSGRGDEALVREKKMLAAKKQTNEEAAKHQKNLRLEQKNPAVEQFEKIVKHIPVLGRFYTQFSKSGAALGATIAGVAALGMAANVGGWMGVGSGQGMGAMKSTMTQIRSAADDMAFLANKDEFMGQIQNMSRYLQQAREAISAGETGGISAIEALQEMGLLQDRAKTLSILSLLPGTDFSAGDTADMYYGAGASMLGNVPLIGGALSAGAYGAYGLYNAGANVLGYASGGVVKATPGGKRITVAEGGRDEAIIPLDPSGEPAYELPQRMRVSESTKYEPPTRRNVSFASVDAPKLQAARAPERPSFQINSNDYCWVSGGAPYGGKTNDIWMNSRLSGIWGTGK